MKITIIGGDERLKIAEQCLQAKGFDTGTFGLYDTDSGDIAGSRVILLPVPTTKDGETVFAPFAKRRIYLSEIENQTAEDQLILCCNYRFKNKRCVDYGALDSYSLLNAVPTAEGAIKLAIEKTPFTLWKSRVLIIGYGRVGKVLAGRLLSLGCSVTVSARKLEDFAMLDALCINHVHTSSINDVPLGYDIIFNTVDVKVIENRSLENCTASLIIDLSSKGGFDLEAAVKNGICAIKPPGLPGIIAPRTAGEILAQTTEELISSYI